MTPSSHIEQGRYLGDLDNIRKRIDGVKNQTK